MTDCREITACRVCGSPCLDLVLDLGKQALAGQFPLMEDEGPPAYPLQVARCLGACGLVQLRHTVDPEAMFRNYFYRSSVSLTMRKHLQDIADSAIGVLGRRPKTILDIGGNDGTLTSHLSVLHEVKCTVVDPSNTVVNGPAWQRFNTFYPCRELEGMKFDIIFSIACLYAQNDPVAFARAVYDNLEENGLWVIEVGYLPLMLSRNGYDGICHEHLCYFGLGSLNSVLTRAGFVIEKTAVNDMNGGSLRVFARKGKVRTLDAEIFGGPLLQQFVYNVEQNRSNIRHYLEARTRENRTIHLLGASTKANTVLQWCGVDTSLVALASDRDPRKRGRKTPGTNIPIISEEESRALRPDIYISVLSHFRQELLQREEAHLKRGGAITFVLPEIDEEKL